MSDLDLYDAHGGPAFPRGTSSRPDSDAITHEGHEGMSLRDYFAARFMERAQSLSETRDGGWDLRNAAQCAYAMADTMLEERASTPLPAETRPLSQGEQLRLDAAQQIYDAMQAVRLHSAFESFTPELRERIKAGLDAFDEADLPF